MKAKIKSGLLIALVMPLLMGCPKSKHAMAPEPDTELQSSIDASFATFVISDLEMLCSFMAEGDQNPVFYTWAPNEDPSKADVFVDPEKVKDVMVYEAMPCRDGRVRDGSVYIYHLSTNPNARHYRNYDFKGKLVLGNPQHLFSVDNWSVKVKDGTTCMIYNNLSSPVFNPSATKLSWTIEGSFEFIHHSDPSRNMTWSGKLTKTLANTADPNVYDPSGTKSIQWANAKVEYRGSVTGVTSGDVPYKMEINEVYPITREFNCAPDPVGGIESIQPLKVWKEEFHPFKSGVVSFTTGDRYPRQIYYGNAENPAVEAPCDNTGQVLIKGNSYSVDFMK